MFCAHARSARSCARAHRPRFPSFPAGAPSNYFRERPLRRAVHAAERPDSESPSEFQSGKQKTAAFERAALGLLFFSGSRRRR